MQRVIVKTSVRILAVAAVALFAMWAADGPAQPLPFSHKDHAGTLKLQCKMCHPSPDPGESMTIAAPSVCMQCHSAIKADSPAIQKLAQYAAESKPVPWVRIYQIPIWVDFSHRAHLAAKNTCEDCHGKVAERDVLSREVNLNMGTCMDCHAGKRAPTGCNFCHEPR
jgi:Cytochrome c7 and related cytochrome c